jgi:hypothetical protein
MCPAALQSKEIKPASIAPICGYRAGMEVSPDARPVLFALAR